MKGSLCSVTDFITCEFRSGSDPFWGAAEAAESSSPRARQHISYAVTPPVSECHCLSGGVVRVPSVPPVALATSALLSSPLLLGSQLCFQSYLFFFITLSAWWSLACLIVILSLLPSSMAVQLLDGETVTHNNSCANKQVSIDIHQ